MARENLAPTLLYFAPMELTLRRRKLNSLVGIFFVTLSILQTPASLAEETAQVMPRIPVEVELPDIQTIGEAQALIREHASDMNLIVSSDNSEIIAAANENPNAIILPFGEIAKPQSQNKFLTLVRNYRTNFKENLHRDKIGISVVTINIGVNSYQWIHSTNLSSFEKTGIVVFTVLSSVLLGFNKDAWSQLTAPIQDVFKFILGKSGQVYPRGSGQDLAFNFAASMTLSSVLSATGALFLPMNKLVDSAMYINAWTLPAMIGFVSTIASFAWSQNMGSIVESKQPFAKYAFRRIQEAKGFFLGLTASTTMLFTPAVYGITPWAVLVGVGAVGLLVYTHNEKITTYFETATVFKKQRDRITKRFRKRMCKDLFI